MKIIKFFAENIKKLRTAEITPDGNLVQITGTNGAGKTSVLDSIAWAIEGTKAIQKQPIRKGEKTAKIQLDLGNDKVELVITRKFTETGSTVTVEAADGSRFGTPQKLLDTLFDKHSFDPLEFARMKPKEQFEVLKKLVKVDVDFALLQRQHEGDFARRQDINRDIKRLEAQASGFKPFAADLPKERIDTAALVDEIAKAGAHNAEIERRIEKRQQVAAEAEADRGAARRAEAEIKRLKDQIKEIEAAIVTAEANNARLLAVAQAKEDRVTNAEPLPAPVDPMKVKADLAKAEAVNSEIDRKQRLEEVRRSQTAAEEQAENITAGMQAREEAKRKAIEEAQMPIEGIGFGDDQVLLNGIPFEQASDAEQLRCSCAIAMAINPKLRVLRVRDGSLLDSKGMEILAEMCKAKDFQCWIECVDDSGKVGIVLSEGEVVAVNPTAVETNSETT